MRLSEKHFTALSVLVASLVMLGAVGCGEPSAEAPIYPARGTATYRNKPLAGAIVALHPTGGALQVDARPSATVQPDGSFRLTTYNSSDGAPEGEYVATLHWFRPVNKNGEVLPGPNVLPKKYGSADSSGIRVRIVAGSNELPPIHLR